MCYIYILLLILGVSVFGRWNERLIGEKELFISSEGWMGDREDRGPILYLFKGDGNEINKILQANINI
jgi:hypothetical protein